MARDFAKSAKTFEEQVQLLQSRGMIVDDIQEATFYLDFELDHATHQFKPDTNFKDVLKLYIFDRELRLLVLDGVVRNLCAHHSRLWNRQFGITIKSPPRKGNAIAGQLAQGSRNLYNTLVIVLYFMDTIATNHHLRSRLLKLLSEQPERLSAMGFPVDWQQMGIWQDIV